MTSINFNEVPGTGGRGWRSEDGTWEIVMFGMGRYRLFHMTPTRTKAGEYRTWDEAKEWAGKLADLIAQAKKAT